MSSSNDLNNNNPMYGDFEEVLKFHKRYPGLYMGSPMHFAHSIQMWKCGGVEFKWDLKRGEWLSPQDYRKLNKHTPLDTASFITIAPSKYRVPIPYTAENIATLKNFGERIAFLYDPYYFVVESGKDAAAPHLHIHILGKIKNSKKHLDQLRSKWTQLCGFVIDWKSDDYDLRKWRSHPDMPTYDEWIAEKVSYMTDDFKGTHSNFEILMGGPGGPGGF